MSELQEIHDKITAFETRMTTVEEDSRKTLSIVTEIKMGLCGSDKLNVEGVVQKVSRHEKCLENLSRADVISKTKKHERYIEADKKQKWMFAGGVSVLLILWGLFEAYIKNKLFKGG